MGTLPTTSFVRGLGWESGLANGMSRNSPLETGFAIACPETHRWKKKSGKFSFDPPFLSENIRFLSFPPAQRKCICQPIDSCHPAGNSPCHPFLPYRPGGYSPSLQQPARVAGCVCIRSTTMQAATRCHNTRPKAPSHPKRQNRAHQGKPQNTSPLLSPRRMLVWKRLWLGIERSQQ